MVKSQTASEKLKRRARKADPELSEQEIDDALAELMRDYRSEMDRQVDEFIDSISESATARLVSEFAEAHRVLPPGSRFPGPFRFSRTPYLREIADALSERSPVQKIAVMKGARIGFSVGVLQNWYLYAMVEVPGPILHVSADKQTAERDMELRIEPMIHESGFGHLIASQIDTKTNRKTGDTKSRKDFPGGNIRAIGPNVAASLRSDPARYEGMDEIDAYPSSVGRAGNEGDPVKLLERRSDEYEEVRKILYGGTPTTAEESRIEELFLYGDQRYYYVPCKHCGHMQPLKWRDDDGDYRIKYELDQYGILIPESVHYECEKCGGRWTNDDKAWFLPRGEWRATATPREPNYQSYHISSLYSPVGMRSWYSVVQEWVNVGQDDSKRKAFIQTVLGQTWVERGDAPDPNRVMLRREEYVTGTLPETADGKAFFVTIGADVHKDRIEAEVVAWGKDKESWSISYHVFDGDTADHNNKPWVELYKLFTAEHCGLRVIQGVVDSGYNSPTTYRWCSQLNGVFPGKGSSYRRNWIVARRKHKEHDVEIAEINTDALKMELYGYLWLGKPAEGEPYQQGYPHFPIDYDKEHFDRLMAESRVPKRNKYGRIEYKWTLPHGRRNEQLDCRVYATAAVYLHAQMVAEEIFEEDSVKWSQYWEWARKTFLPS